MPSLADKLKSLGVKASAQSLSRASEIRPPVTKATASTPLEEALNGRWIETRCFRYAITDQRIRVTQGVFNKQTDSLELYRVKDVVLFEPFGLRLFHLGNIELRTSDMTSPLLVLRAVPEPAALREKILLAAEARRDAKGVREMDVSDRIVH